jgi:hypothetical protein
VEITGQEWIKQDRRGYKKGGRGYNRTGKDNWTEVD